MCRSASRPLRSLAEQNSGRSHERHKELVTFLPWPARADHTKTHLELIDHARRSAGRSIGTRVVIDRNDSAEVAQGTAESGITMRLRISELLKNLDLPKAGRQPETPRTARPNQHLSRLFFAQTLFAQTLFEETLHIRMLRCWLDLQELNRDWWSRGGSNS
jgi:hypothetical protein